MSAGAAGPSKRRSHAVAGAALLGALAVGSACGGRPAEPVTPALPRGQFRCELADGSVVSEATTGGGPTLVIYLLTYELRAQVAVQLVDRLRPRLPSDLLIYAAAFDDEPNKPLVWAFGESLHLGFPMCWVPRSELLRLQERADVVVPSFLYLDADGRVLLDQRGLLPADELEQALLTAGRGEPVGTVAPSVAP